jgi:hypothetical protein
MSRGFVFLLAVVVFIVAPAVGRMGVSLKVLDDAVEPRGPERVEQKPAPRALEKPRRKGYARSTDYQLPAGSVIAVRLRTTVGSATSAVGDQVDATLAEAVTQDGVELIPAGSQMHGSVVDALPASERELRGRVAVAFFVIEHVRTGSRASIKTRRIALDAPQPLRKQTADVQLLAGQVLNLVLIEPLLVRIPK